MRIYVCIYVCMYVRNEFMTYYMKVCIDSTVCINV